jgi:hypothetical protein
LIITSHHPSLSSPHYSFLPSYNKVICLEFGDCDLCNYRFLLLHDRFPQVSGIKIAEILTIYQKIEIYKTFPSPARFYFRFPVLPNVAQRTHARTHAHMTVTWTSHPTAEGSETRGQAPPTSNSTHFISYFSLIRRLTYCAVSCEALSDFILIGGYFFSRRKNLRDFQQGNTA